MLGFVTPIKFWFWADLQFEYTYIVSSLLVFFNLMRLLNTYSKGIEAMSWLVKVLNKCVSDMKWFMVILWLIAITFTFIFRQIFDRTQADCSIVPMNGYGDRNGTVLLANLQGDCERAPYGSFAEAFITTFEMIILGSCK